MEEFLEEVHQEDSQEAQQSAQENAGVLEEQKTREDESPVSEEFIVEDVVEASEGPTCEEESVEEPLADEKIEEASEAVDVVEISDEPTSEEESVEESSSDEKIEDESEAVDAIEATEGEESQPEASASDAEAHVEDGPPLTAEEISELEQKRSILNNDAERHRRVRDELNNQTKEWKSKRDALNARVREIVDEAGKCREERDNFNQKVRETKVIRDECNQKVTALKDQISVLRPERSGENKNEVPIKQLKKQLQELEFTQQTKSLGKDKENEIVKQISVIAKQIDEREKSFEQNGEIKEIVQQLRDAKVEAEAAHHQVSEYADAAQTSHDKMLKHYEEADKLRKEADAAQAKFVEFKQAADEEHKKHIEQIKSVHEMDKDFAGIRNKKTVAKKKKIDTESKKEAKEIFERFKAGEKLSTDNLMTLQKSGYL